MADFPILKTGAIAQYPLVRGLRYATQSVRFIDGSRQRFRLHGRQLRRWTVALEQLDETELAALIAFVEEQASGTFTFNDPVNGEAVAACAIAGEQFAAGMIREMNGHATLLIEEVG
ncbi:MAG TPA: hypothetical protein VG273_21640 [Bryobacteraceae bacterium]|jgi:hypothetical protein|nr:hypothetical protein [Bryobacteraceae bacterium]